MVNKSFKPSVWPSKITAASLTTHTISMQYLTADQEKNLYWQEKRPTEKGRTTICKEGRDLLPKDISIRTKVHEYGGVAYLVSGEKIYFSNAKDQRLYKLEEGQISPVTGEPSMSYADGSYHKQKELLYYVREESIENNEPKNTLVVIDPKTGKEKVIHNEHDFYAAPRVSFDGQSLAFIAWDHPNMPWDSSYLYIATIGEDGSFIDCKKIAGDKRISCIEPRWSKEGALYFLDDRTGYWNLYCFDGNAIQPVCELEAELGYPQWVFGIKTYALTDNGDIYFLYVEKGGQKFGKIVRGVLEQISFDKIDPSLIWIDDLTIEGETLYFIAGFTNKSAELLKLDLQTFKIDTLKKASKDALDPSYISRAQSLSFPSKDGSIVYGLFYSPTHPKYFSEKPPLIVRVHGGPTAIATPKLNSEVQYWTSRGFAVVDVNYRGSCGFGREYREKLLGGWGKVDVEDCQACVDHLISEGIVDKDKIIIKGRSSGGYTALAALTFTESFSVAASYYGIGDLIAMTEETHKFEKYYLDGLIGPFPEKKDLYEKRSPINFPDQLKKPIILFHGQEDKVVSCTQSEKIFKALLENGVPSAYLLFEKEGHGFRDADTMTQALEAELYFYTKIFGLSIEENLKQIPIVNFKERS